MHSTSATQLSNANNRRICNSCGTGLQDDTTKSPHDQELVRSVISIFQKRLGDVSQQQREVSRSREKLLMQREQLRILSKNLYGAREKTAMVEGSWMNLLRQFYNERDFALLGKIEEAYQTVQQERDELGVAEQEWLEAERMLGGAEWAFIKREEELYEYSLADQFSDEFFRNILDQFTPRPAQHGLREEYNSAVKDLERLRKEINSLREHQVAYIEKMPEVSHIGDFDGLPEQDGDFVGRYESLLAQVADTEVIAQQLKQTLMEDETRRRSSLPLITGPTEPYRGLAERARTDGGLTNLQDNFAEARPRIIEWLWDQLLNNAVEKIQYREMLKYFGASVSNESWQDQALLFWDADSSEQYEEHVDSPPSRQTAAHHTHERTTTVSSIPNNAIEEGNHALFRDPNNAGPSPNYEDDISYGAGIPGPPPPMPPNPGYQLIYVYDSGDDEGGPHLVAMPYDGPEPAFHSAQQPPPGPILPAPSYLTVEDASHLEVPGRDRHDSHQGSEPSDTIPQQQIVSEPVPFTHGDQIPLARAIDTQSHVRPPAVGISDASQDDSLFIIGAEPPPDHDTQEQNNSATEPDHREISILSTSEGRKTDGDNTTTTDNGLGVSYVSQEPSDTITSDLPVINISHSPPSSTIDASIIPQPTMEQSYSRSERRRPASYCSPRSNQDQTPYLDSKSRRKSVGLPSSSEHPRWTGGKSKGRAFGTEVENLADIPSINAWLEIAADKTPWSPIDIRTSRPHSHHTSHPRAVRII